MKLLDKSIARLDRLELQFSKEVEVVYIVPPVLDQINRWMRDHRMDEAAPSDETEPEADEERSR